jgi:hypothetical protein
LALGYETDIAAFEPLGEFVLGLRGRDKQQDALVDENRAVPEGLKRPPKGPLDKTVGRGNEDSTKQQPSTGERLPNNRADRKLS